MKNRLALFGCVMCVMLAAVFVQVSQAQTWDKRTRITINKPWSLPGNTVLQPGTYVMRLYDSPTTRQMVEVWDADETKLEARVIGLAAYRLEPSNDTVLNFHEQGGQCCAAALQSWFHPGDLSGVEFPAPPSVAKDLAYVEIKVPEVAPPAVAEAPPAPPAPQPEPEVAPQPEPPQMAENNPPPAPLPEPELPRTASDAPILGLIGLISLAGAVFFRSLVQS